jgi:hypothetical protein
MVRTLDEWVEGGKFKSRSDAMRTHLFEYEDREKTREFYRLIAKRSREAHEHPGELRSLEWVGCVTRTSPLKGLGIPRQETTSTLRHSKINLRKPAAPRCFESFE